MPPSRERFTEDWRELVDPDTGQLAPRVPLDALWVPGKVALKEGALFFDWRWPFDYLLPSSQLLDNFLKSASDAAVLGFAKKYGPLGIYDPGDETRLVHRYRGPIHGKLADREPMELWRRVRREFKVLLSLVAQLREGQQIRDEICEELEQLGIISSAPDRTLGDLLDPAKVSLARQVRWSPLGGWKGQTPDARRRGALDVVTEHCMGLVRRAGLRPALEIGSAGSAMAVTLVFQDAVTDKVGVGLSLFGALTTQALAVISGSGFATCSACGNAYAPQRRRPSVGRRRYCPNCGHAAALRDAKADYRARSREQRRRRVTQAERRRKKRTK